MNETMKMLLSRKSIRDYVDRPVPRDVRDEILLAALRSPTAGNLMLYSIIEVDDQDLKDSLARICDRQRFIGKAPWILLFLADYQRWMEDFKFSGVESLCAAEQREMERPREGDLVLAMSDALLAAQTTAVAAEAQGLGSCFVGDILQHSESQREMFGLPRYVFPVALLCLGYPSEGAQLVPQRPRFEARHIVFKDRYRICDATDFDEMAREAGSDSIRFRTGAANFGQHIYLKKFSTAFGAELRRSVRSLLDDWA